MYLQRLKEKYHNAVLVDIYQKDKANLEKFFQGFYISQGSK